MSNTMCNAVTHTVSNSVRRCVQNQNQNQTLVTRSLGWSFGHLIHPSLRAVWVALGDEKRMGRYAAAAGGGQ